MRQILERLAWHLPQLDYYKTCVRVFPAREKHLGPLPSHYKPTGEPGLYVLKPLPPEPEKEKR